MSITYIGARIGMFILVVWLATTVIFFLPRIASDRNPVRERLVMMAATGNLATGMEKVVAAYEQEYGLDQPLYLQYIRYLSSLVRGDLNYSLINYPTRVWDMIVQRMPYTLGLVGVSVLTAFTLGSLSGATLAWPGAPKWLKGMRCQIFLTFSPIPYFMLAIMLMFLFAVRHQWQPEWWPLLPLAGATSVTTVYDGWNVDSYPRHHLSLDLAGNVDHPLPDRILGLGNARDDGNHAGRRLRDVSPNARLESQAASSACTECETPLYRN